MAKAMGYFAERGELTGNDCMPRTSTVEFVDTLGRLPNPNSSRTSAMAPILLAR